MTGKKASMKARPDVDSNSADALLGCKAVLGDALRWQILNVELVPDVIVSEPTLCDEFGPLRPPVHELLRQIAAEGYIELGADRAPCVMAMGRGLLHAFSLVAPLIYITTTQLATTHASKAEIETLRAIQEDLCRAIEEKHMENRAIHNDAFHLEIGRMARNNYLMPSLRRLLIDHARLGKIFYRHPTIDDMQHDLELTYDQCDQIVGATQRCGLDVAAGTARTHSELSYRRMAEYAAPAGVEVALAYEGQ